MKDLSPKKSILVKTISALVACILALAVYILLNRFIDQIGIYSTAGRLAILLALALLIYTLTQKLLFRQLNKIEEALIAAAYALLIISGLFLRQSGRMFSFDFFNIGGYGFGLNPLSFIRESRYDSSLMLVNILNVLLFVPLKPILAINRIRAPWWLVIIGFFVLELLQFVLGAGFFDLGDIVLYTGGFLIGLGIWRLVKWKK